MPVGVTMSWPYPRAEAWNLLRPREYYILAGLNCAPQMWRPGVDLIVNGGRDGE
jgi:hypothetical protein